MAVTADGETALPESRLLKPQINTATFIQSVLANGYFISLLSTDKNVMCEC